jgi:hypothetical protein
MSSVLTRLSPTNLAIFVSAAMAISAANNSLCLIDASRWDFRPWSCANLEVSARGKQCTEASARPRNGPVLLAVKTALEFKLLIGHKRNPRRSAGGF